MTTIEIVSKNECVGCALCHDVCPLKAIQMHADDKGFPQPLIDHEKCTNCGMCAEKCPVLRFDIRSEVNPPLESYAAYSNDDDIRYMSTSGGAFSELAAAVLKTGGVVIGAAYDDDYSVYHRTATTLEELSLLRQSKYVQSKTAGIFVTVRALLDEGKKVLFAGTPCLIGALYSYLGTDNEGLLTVDFLCLGINSPWAYHEYLKSLEKEAESPIKRVWFKNKELGWNRFSTRVDFSNGKSYRKDRATDSFMRGYIVHPLYIREGCTRCHFKSMPHQSDITLGDFWGVEKVIHDIDSRHGVSVIFVNSSKGRELVASSRDSLRLWPVSFEEALRPENRNAISHSVVLDTRSDRFYSDLREYGFEKAIRRNASDKLVVKAKRAVKQLLGGVFDRSR